MVTVINV